jgi:peptidylamidoglycolate lyase
MVPGSDETHFCKPTDVAVAKSGEVFVSDGYCNSRIIKFSADGKFISSFGSPNCMF